MQSLEDDSAVEVIAMQLRADAALRNEHFTSNSENCRIPSS
jgi:hypothetical protein